MFSKRRSKNSPTVTPDQEQVLASELKSRVSQLEVFVENQELQSWVQESTLIRYLRARDHDVDKAFAMLTASLQWRVKERVRDYLSAASSSRWEVIRSEAETGKMFVLPGRAKLDRPIIVMRPGLENSADPDKNMMYLVYTLERASAMCQPGSDGKFVVIEDYSAGEFSLRRAPSLATSKRTLAIMQDHFPERLGQSILVDAPSFLNTLFKILKTFMDARTVAKLHFVDRADAATDSVCQATLEPSSTPTEYGGKLDFKFDAKEYFRDT